jgi:hypothetical protein
MTINRDKKKDRAKTRDTILNSPHPPYAGGANWLGHGARPGQVGGARVDYLLLDGATEAQLQKARPTFRRHFEHLEKAHGLLVTDHEPFRFDREDLGITEAIQSGAPLAFDDLAWQRVDGRPARQPDPHLRSQVERAAVEVTARHFTLSGYTVDSVEGDSCGWDLTALQGAEVLRLEVKGLSGSELVVELTPNEFARMQEHRDSYRLCVVINALAAARLSVFEYSADAGTWTDGDRRLDIETRIAARCRVAAG